MQYLKLEDTMTASTCELKSTMDKMSCQCVDGVTYLMYLNQDVAKQIEIIKHLALREDDVISVGFPRSGNHWAFEVVNMVLRENQKLTERYFHKCLLERIGHSVAEEMEKMPSPRFVTTHSRVNRLPIQAVEKKIRIVYLIRNPKDALVSYYKLMSSFVDDKLRFQGTWDQFFEIHMAGEFIQGTWLDHVFAMDEFMKQHPNQPVYIHSFEKMKTEPVAAIKELCSFLGKSDSLAEQIAEVTEFKSMKKLLAEGKFKGDSKFSGKTVDSLLRKGEIGGWKELFTVSQSERFDKAFNEKMSGCKLADYVKDYL